MISYPFEVCCLSPVHIGANLAIDPSQYLIKESKLHLFDSIAVIGSMTDDQLRRLENKLDCDELNAAQELIRAAYKPQDHEILRRAISKESIRDLDDSGTADNRKRECQLLGYSRLSGAAVLPGSAIKGAIRTAVTSKRALELRNEEREQIEKRDLKARNDYLQNKALGFEPHNQNSGNDPFNLWQVAGDIILPPDSSVISRVELSKADGGSSKTKGMQIHVERTRTTAEGGKPTKITLNYDNRKASHKLSKSKFGRRFDFEYLRKACNTFYLGRLNAELDEFCANNKSEALKMRYGMDGVVEYSGKELRFTEQFQQNGLLLRVGRFSHFESLSVDGLRDGDRPQARGSNKERIRDPDMSWIRALCCKGDQRMSFGWLALRLHKPK